VCASPEQGPTTQR